MTRRPARDASCADGETFVMHVTTEEETAPPAIVVVHDCIREFQDGE